MAGFIFVDFDFVERKKFWHADLESGVAGLVVNACQNERP